MAAVQADAAHEADQAAQNGVVEARLDQLGDGGELPADDCAWKAGYEARMSPEQLDYWQTVQEYGE